MRSICLMVAALGLCASAGIAAEQPGGYSPDNDGFICNWLLLDPIEVGEKAATHEEDSEKECGGAPYPGSRNGRPGCPDTGPPAVHG